MKKDRQKNNLIIVLSLRKGACKVPKKSLMSVSADLATAVLSIRSGSLFIRDSLQAVNRGALDIYRGPCLRHCLIKINNTILSVTLCSNLLVKYND